MPRSEVIRLPKAYVVPSIDILSQKILIIRGQRVMLDRDLAALYGVKPIALRQQVKRNIERFPADFMLTLTSDESQALLSQNVIPATSRLGGSLPYVFTQEGVAMLSSVLRSPQAIKVNIALMRAFVRMREAMMAHKDLAKRIDELEKKYDSQFKSVFDVMRELITVSAKKTKPIGYIHPQDTKDKARNKRR